MESWSDDDEDKSISSESSGGGIEVTSNSHNQNVREDLDIWNACEINLTLGTLHNIEQAKELLNLTDLSQLNSGVFNNENKIIIRTRSFCKVLER